jgi:hypothetical protein
LQFIKSFGKQAKEQLVFSTGSAPELFQNAIAAHPAVESKPAVFGHRPSAPRYRMPATFPLAKTKNSMAKDTLSKKMI